MKICYSCSNCGGKLEYDKNDNTWFCEYCNKHYKFSLVYNGENVISTSDYVSIYSFCYCEFCGKKIATKVKFECPYCGAKLLVKEKKEICGIADKTLSNSSSILQYNKTMSYFLNNDIALKFYNVFFQDKYVYCNLYSGFVELSYKDIEEKYVFLNVPIPCIKLDNYMFAYEISNNGCPSKEGMFEFERFKDETLYKSSIYDEIVNDEEAVNKEEIVNKCFDSFVKRHNVDDTKNVKLSSNLSIKNGFLFPFYVGTVNFNDKNYDEYILRYLDNKKDPFILALPYRKINSKICRFFFFFFLFLLLISFIFLMIFSFLAYLLHININYVFISLFVFILSFVFVYRYDKMLKYCKNTINVSKDEYLSQLVDNSNFVKKIRRK